MKRVFHTISSVAKKAFLVFFLLNFVFSPTFNNILLSSNLSAPLAASVAEAAFNQQINYQGKLMNALNVSVANGSYNIEFKLYTSLTGGSPIWTETWCKGVSCSGTGDDNRIPVVSGLFSTMLGSTTALTNVDFNQPLYLSINIGGSSDTPSWDGEMSPRKILGAVPAAFEAKRLNGLNDTQFVRTDTSNATSTASTFITLTQSGAGNILNLVGQNSASVFTALSSGNVGIGTTSPGQKLSVAGDILGNNIIGSYFTATSSSATSTFAGGITGPGSFTVQTSSGYVGIGTASPSAKLHVTGLRSNNTARVLVTDETGAIARLNADGYTNGTDAAANLFLSGDGNQQIKMVSGGMPSYITAASASLSLSNGGSYGLTIASNASSILGTFAIDASGSSGWVPLTITANDSQATNVISIGKSSSAGSYLLMNSSGNLGIGTTSPGQKLSVAGDILGNNIIGSYFTGTSTTASTLAGALTSSGIVTGSALVASSASATSTLAGGLAIETSGFVYDYSTNNVGIGTASPLTKLHVHDGNVLIDNSYGLIFGTNGSALTSYQKISGAANQENLTYATYSDHIFTTDTNSSGVGTTRLTIKGTSGNVGIGTTSPATTLSVAGDGYVTGEIGVGLSSTGNANVKIQSQGSTSGGGIANWIGNTSNGTNGWSELGLYNDQGTGSRAQLLLTSSGFTGSDGANALSLYNNMAAPIILGTNGTERVRILSGGNVGIGTTSPGQKLSVAGDILGNNIIGSYFTATSSSATSTFAGGITGPGSFTVQSSSGSVGIGTASPLKKLHIATGNSNGLMMSFDGSSYRNSIENSFAGGSAVDNILTFNVSNGTATGQVTALTLKGNNSALFGGDVTSGYVSMGTTAGSSSGNWVNLGSNSTAGLLLGSNLYDDAGQLKISLTHSNMAGAGIKIPGNGETRQGNIEFWTTPTGSVTAGSNFAQSSPRLVIDTSGNVGIGTTSPGQKLSVAGDILGNNIIGSYFTATSSAATSTLAGGLAIETSGLVYDYSSNNVGIGTASPVEKLQIDNGRIKFNNTSNGNEFIFDASAGNAIGDFDIWHNESTDKTLGLFGNGSANFNLKLADGILQVAGTGNSYFTGNLGIGTTSPVAKLVVSGDSANFYATTNSGLTGSGRFIALDTYTSSGEYGLVFRRQVTGETMKLSTDDGTGDVVLQNSWSAYGIRFNTSGANTRMYISGTGNVGIGTTSPGQKLSVAGDILGNNIIGSYFTGTSTTASTLAGALTSSGTVTGTNLVASSASATSTLAGGLAIETSGFVYDYSSNNVGIGTTSPAAKFAVQGNVSGVLAPFVQFVGQDASTNSVVQITPNGGTGSAFLNLLGGGGTSYLVGSTGSGSGIGNNRFTIYDGTDRFTIQSGNVGIGSTTPATTLSVAGSTYITTGLGVGKVNTTANSIDVATGGSYRINGTRLATGVTANYSYFFGEAGNPSIANVTGAGNNAFGSGALYSITSGQFNTALGVNTALNLTTGVHNIAMGRDALFTTTDGQYNIALGYYALRQNTDGDYNVAIGQQAGRANTTGYGGVFIGYYAGDANTTGANNTAIGAGALQENTAGEYNMAIGYQALNGIQGSRNTAFGSIAGGLNLAGDNNIYIGYNAGINQTAGSKNIVIGDSVHVASTTGSNQLNIGNLIYGTGLTGTGSTIAGNIGIGTTSPATTLSVAGSTYITTGLGVGKVNTTANTVDLASLSSNYGAYRINGVNIAIASTTTNNYFFGGNAGNSTTINTTMTGTLNTGVGASALNALTTGTSNTAVGYSQAVVTTGGYNASLGAQALRDTTIGSYNTVLGSNALIIATSTDYNTAIGYLAMGNAQYSGSRNIAIGPGTLYSNTLGNDNLAIGGTLNSAAALTSNTTGSGNVAVGGSASALGFSYGALRTNTTGSLNTALGVAALAYSTTGSNNTVIGAGAGSTIGTGSNNTLLGYGADTVLANDSYYMNLGGVIFATSTNYTNTTNNFVGIGTSSPSARFAVKGTGTGTGRAFTVANSSNVDKFTVLDDGSTKIVGDVTLTSGNITSVAGMNITMGTNSNMTFNGNSAVIMNLVGASGKVGIGTTSPYAALSVVGSTGVVAQMYTATSTTATSTFAGGLDVGSGALTYDFSSGITSISNLALGAMSFDTNAGAVSWADMPVTSDAAAGTAESYSAQVDGTTILTVYAESDGAGAIQYPRVGINKSNPAFGLDVVGTVGFTSGLNAVLTGGSALCIDGATGTNTGEVYDAGGDTCSVSSARFKHDIETLGATSGLSLVRQLRPVSFSLNSNNESRIGFIAEEVTLLEPRLVFNEVGSTTPRGVRYQEMTAILAKAIQELATTTSFISNNYASTTALLAVTADGKIGIGTTSPLYSLHVVGDVGATSFVNISTREAKRDISYLNATDSAQILEKLKGMKVATYHYLNEASVNPLRLGFIAEEAPAEVLSATGKGVDVYKLATFILAGVQTQQVKIESLEARVARLEAVGVGGGNGGVSVATVISSLEQLGSTFSSALAQFKKVVAESFTVGTAEKPSGITLYDEVTKAPYCLKMVNGVMTSAAGVCTNVSDAPATSEPASAPAPEPAAPAEGGTAPSSADTQAPTITVNGNNPATIEKNASYLDLGATVSDDVSQNIGYQTTGDQIDTSVPGTYTVTYTATDVAGNTATATRTVVVTDPTVPVTPAPVEPAPAEVEPAPVEEPVAPVVSGN